MPNKAKALTREQFLTKLFDLLSYTRAASDLVRIEYLENEYGDWWAVLVFNTGYKKRVCCTADSYSAVIEDVVHALY